MSAVVAAPDGDLRKTPRYPELLCLDECRRHGEGFTALVLAAAAGAGVESRALAVRTLLQLPRTASPAGMLTRTQVVDDLSRCAAELRDSTGRLRDLLPTASFAIQDLRFRRLTDDEAAKIFGHLHYLRSARPGSLAFALTDPLDDRPVTMCSVTPLQWRVVSRRLHTQFGFEPGEVWDVSRVYAFDTAPPNAISCLLSKVRTTLRRSVPQVKLLTTAVDPNLGFHGSSYRAANWQRWMTVRPRPYLYVDGTYITPRQLRERYGTANLDEIRRLSGQRVEQSRAELLDSLIFCCRTKGRTESPPPDDQPRLRRR